MSKVEDQVVVACTMIGKLRVEKAVESIEKWLGIKNLYSVPMLFEGDWEAKINTLKYYMVRIACPV